MGAPVLFARRYLGEMMFSKLAGFTGLPAQVAKVAFMAIIDALLITMFFAALNKHAASLEYVIAAVFIATNLVYFAKFTLPFKFLLPGLLLLTVFVVVPVAYTIQMSVFNYKTGNEVTKQEAIVQLTRNGLAPDAAGTTYDMVLGKVDGKYAALLTSQIDQSVTLVNTEKVFPISQSAFTRDAYKIARSAPGFIPLTDAEVVAADSIISELKFPISKGEFVQPQSADVAGLLTQSIYYDAKKDQITDLSTGEIYRDNGNGNFADTKNSAKLLQPGWKSFSGIQNYTALLSDPEVRGPFIGVFIWTTLFAFISVGLMFVVGLLLAITLNRKIALRRFYRAILILPYAIPSFMSILVWKGIFNTQYGAFNALFHTHIDFYNNIWLSRGIILLVNLWLGFPYFYLISSGALQSIPSELEEAAALDGANPTQILRRIKLPLIFQILSPLLIASFAFNFNNFNIIYLLTNGGPTPLGKTAGATDILITYTYKTAFGSSIQNLGLACAISVVIFLVVGSVSIWGLRRSKVLDVI
jgi:arabinogalactan oligomer/maltooligosaccharide transport system permease protein